MDLKDMQEKIKENKYILPIIPQVNRVQQKLMKSTEITNK
jgi:hypothetical protein